MQDSIDSLSNGAKASGPKGKVIVFEAHPEIFTDLKKNILKWRDLHSIAEIQMENFGVSDQQGEAELVITNEFDSNHGSASIYNQTDENKFKGPNTYTTNLQTLSSSENSFSKQQRSSRIDSSNRGNAMGERKQQRKW